MIEKITSPREPKAVVISDTVQRYASMRLKWLKNNVPKIFQSELAETRILLHQSLFAALDMMVKFKFNEPEQCSVAYWKRAYHKPNEKIDRRTLARMI